MHISLWCRLFWSTRIMWVSTSFATIVLNRSYSVMCSVRSHFEQIEVPWQDRRKTLMAGTSRGGGWSIVDLVFPLFLFPSHTSITLAHHTHAHMHTQFVTIMKSIRRIQYWNTQGQIHVRITISREGERTREGRMEYSLNSTIIMVRNS